MCDYIFLTKTERTFVKKRRFNVIPRIQKIPGGQFERV
jgi:hypothetical protein